MRACHPFVCVTSKAVRPGMKKGCRSVGNNKKGEKKEEQEGKTFFSSVPFLLDN